MSNSITDVIYKNTEYLPTEKGNKGDVLTSDGVTCSWEAPSGGALPAATKGDILYASAKDTWSNLGIGAKDDYYLVVNGGVPKWSAMATKTLVMTYNYNIVDTSGIKGTFEGNAQFGFATVITPIKYSPDIPRSININVINGWVDELATAKFTINGLDCNGNVIAEEYIIPKIAGGGGLSVTVTGTKAFYLITTVVFSCDDAGYRIDFSAGFGDVMGIPNSPYVAASDLIHFSEIADPTITGVLAPTTGYITISKGSLTALQSFMIMVKNTI